MSQLLVYVLSRKREGWCLLQVALVPASWQDLRDPSPAGCIVSEDEACSANSFLCGFRRTSKSRTTGDLNYQMIGRPCAIRLDLPAEDINSHKVSIPSSAMSHYRRYKTTKREGHYRYVACIGRGRGSFQTQATVLELAGRRRDSLSNCRYKYRITRPPHNVRASSGDSFGGQREWVCWSD